jgi:hypothetical protein
MNRTHSTNRFSRRSFLGRLTGVLLALPTTTVFARAAAGALAKWDATKEVAFTLEVATQEGFRTHRPYVAVWIEDTTGQSVRTVSLWVQTGRRGPRWIPDLRRWYRGEQARMAASGGDLVTTVSSATRESGVYTVVWDGKSDAGKYVDQGDYYVCIEAAREHGTYQLIREKITFGSKPFKKILEGNVEIKGATIELRKKA